MESKDKVRSVGFASACDILKKASKFVWIIKMKAYRKYLLKTKLQRVCTSFFIKSFLLKYSPLS